MRCSYSYLSTSFPPELLIENTVMYIGRYQSPVIEELLTIDDYGAVIHDVRGLYGGRKLYFGVDVKIDLLADPTLFLQSLGAVAGMWGLNFRYWRLVAPQILRDIRREDEYGLNSLVEKVLVRASESGGIEKAGYLELYYLLDMIVGDSDPSLYDVESEDTDVPNSSIINYSLMTEFGALVASLIASQRISNTLQVLMDGDSLAYAAQPLIWRIVREGLVVHLNRLYRDLIPFFNVVVAQQGFFEKDVLDLYRSVEGLLEDFVIYDKDVWLGLTPTLPTPVDEGEAIPENEIPEDYLTKYRELVEEIINVVAEYGQLSEEGVILKIPSYRMELVKKVVHLLWRDGYLKRIIRRGGVFYRPTVKGYKLLRGGEEDE